MFSHLAGSSTAPPPPLQIAGSFLLVYGIYKISAFIYDELTSPVRDIPGPPSPSLIYGNFKELVESTNSEIYEKWVNQYGNTIQFKMMFGQSRIMTTDLKAINYMLFNNYDYLKHDGTSNILRRIFGTGIVAVERDVHKHQRKILNPAFGPQQIRNFTEIFVEKGLELRDIWSAEIVKNGGVASIDCLSWMSRTTLDIIGLAAFNYEFNALTSDPEKNELIKAFSIIFKAGAKRSIVPILKGMYPALRFIPTETDTVIEKATLTMEGIGTQLIKECTASLEDDKRNGSKLSSRKDILSLLIQANTDQDLPEDQRLKHEDMMSQIPTFITAGHETTSNAMSWAIYALTQNKQIQTKLREELSQLSTDNPTMDDLNGLPYLDAFVRETLRLYSPVPSVIRAAGKDDCIPLSKPFMDKYGVAHNELRVRKGQPIMIPITMINLDKSIWGEDSAEFKPERWTNIPDAASSIPGVWANMMTFIGGPRACIGYRFSIVETKALLFTLVRAFEFDLAVPAKDIGTTPMGLQRPILLTDPNNSNQMPLLVRPVPNF